MQHDDMVSIPSKKRQPGPEFYGRRYLRFAELRAIGLVSNRPTLDRWVKNGFFPAPLRLGPRVLIWDVEEIRALLAKRATKRDAGEGSHE
jgi:predicted DNA-binding transcriptional regulator AlpA